MKTNSIINKRNLVKAVMVLYDAIAVNFAFFFGLVVRYFVSNELNDGAVILIEIFWKFAPYYAVASVVIFALFKLYNTMWEFADINDLNRVLCACVVAAVVYVIGTIVFFERMTLSYYAIGSVLQIVLIAGSRFAYKFYLMERNQGARARRGIVNTMVIGVAGIGQFARKQVLESTKMKLVCVMNAASTHSTEYLSGVPVIGGISNLEKALAKNHVRHVVIADEHLTEEQVAEIKQICEAADVEVQDFIEYLRNNNDGEAPVVLKTNDEGARVIPFSPPDITDSEIEEVKRALKSGWITTGPRTKELERKLAAFCHTSKVVCLNSATAAEELNFRICGIGEGDEVLAV